MKILCGGTQCGLYLGDVGPSAISMKPGPVWYIQPGWDWAFPLGTRGQPLGCAILERRDASRQAERRLAHEIYAVPDGTRLDERISVAREANLPIVVRCPGCHRLRFIPPEVVTRPVLLRA